MLSSWQIYVKQLCRRSAIYEQFSTNILNIQTNGQEGLGVNGIDFVVGSIIS